MPGYRSEGKVTPSGAVILWSEQERMTHLRDDITAFFAGREIPGAERALGQTLARIDARIHFRAQQQRMFDALPKPSQVNLKAEELVVNWARFGR